MNWADLTQQQKTAVEKAYRAGKEPIDIASRYGLKPKQVSDQAYRKNWARPRRPGQAKRGRPRATSRR